jgi:transcriptional regulator with XRE-family HTH domain
MARANKQMSHKEVASLAGTSPATISELENGKADPLLSTFARIAGVLDITVRLEQAA